MIAIYRPNGLDPNEKIRNPHIQITHDESQRVQEFRGRKELHPHTMMGNGAVNITTTMPGSIPQDCEPQDIIQY